jgi:hypothetical protein
MTAEELTERMRDYNRHVAPGSECAAWQDYIEDFIHEHGETPWKEPSAELEGGFADYWVDVANGCSDEYHAETGERTS